MKTKTIEFLRDKIAVVLSVFLILGILIILSGSEAAVSVPYGVSVFTIVSCMLSGAAFKFYLDGFGERIPVIFKNVLSIIYGISGYLLLQDEENIKMVMFILVPVLIFYSEKLILSGESEKKSGLMTVLLLSVSFIMLPMDAVPVAFCLTVYIICVLSYGSSDRIYPFLRFLSCLFLSVLLSSFRIFPMITDHLMNDPVYNGYYYHYFPTTLGFVAVFLWIAFFISTGTGVKKKAALLFAYLFVYIGGITGFFGMVFSLGLYTDGQTYAYDLMFAFMALRIAAEGSAALTKETREKDRRKAVPQMLCLTALTILSVLCLLFIFIESGSYRGGKLSYALLAAGIVTGAGLIFTCLTKKNGYGIISMVLLVISLLCGILNETGERLYVDGKLLAYTTNENIKGFFMPSEIDGSGFVSGNLQISDSVGLSGDVYQEFLEEHSDMGLLYAVDTLRNGVGITLDEKKEYGGTLILDDIDELNAICRKIGCEKDVFINKRPAKVRFEGSEEYLIVDQAQDIYNIEFFLPDDYTGGTMFVLPYTIDINENDIKEGSGDIYIYNTYSNNFIKCDKKELMEDKVFYTDVLGENSYSINFQLLLFEIDDKMYDRMSDLAKDYLRKDGGVRGTDIAGLVLSVLGAAILLLIFGRNEADKDPAATIDKMLRKIALSRPVIFLRDLLVNNRIYIVAFLIPFLFQLMILIANNCIPFGNNSLFDSDGGQLVIPSLWEVAASAKSGNRFLSMNGGYGYSLYNINSLTDIYRALGILSKTGIVAFYEFWECILLGFCAVAMIWYLTHRYFGDRADKNDVRLLVPALVYSLNAHMLSIHLYPGWYKNYVLLPFVIFGFERMMKEKKVGLYGILLLLSTVFNIQLAMYLCIFLVIYFLSSKFGSVKEFFINGIRFAVTSVLAVLPAFFIVSAAITGTNDSGYRGQDEVFPIPGFHKSFFDQWKKFLFMTPVKAVDKDNGGLNIYFGIIALILVILFLSYGKIKARKRFALLPAVLFVMISFNGKVLSYLWNGFHYQTMVPNRYGYLFIFLMGILAYEGVLVIGEVSYKHILVSSVSIALFFVICVFFGKENMAPAYIASALVMIICIVLLYPERYRAGVAVFILLFELVIQGVYGSKGIGFNEITYFGDFENEGKVIRDLVLDDDLARVNFPNSEMVNPGAVYSVPSISLFNSYVTGHQRLTAYVHGYLVMVNALMGKSNTTPIGNDLAGVKYICVAKKAKGAVLDLEHYDYLGSDGEYFLFQNPDVLPIGMRVPESIIGVTQHLSNTIDLQNAIWGAFTDDTEGESPLYLGLLEYGNKGTDHVEMTDAKGNPLSLDEVQVFCDEAVAKGGHTSVPKVRMHIHVEPERSGQLYLYDMEMIPLGYVEEGKPVDIEIPYPNTILQGEGRYNYAILNEEIYEKGLEKIKENTAGEASFGNDTISTVTDYDKDGYTMFSIAFDPGYTAYLDGKKTEVEDLLGSMIFVRTPAGEHRIELVYDPPGRKMGIMISLIAFAIDLILLFVYTKLQRIKK